MRFERREGVPLPVDNISLTSGSMQALDLVLSTFVEPGDTILTEELTYSGYARYNETSQGEYRWHSMDYVDGMNVDALDIRLKELKAQGIRPKLIYTTANHQNPTAAILTLQRRDKSA